MDVSVTHTEAQNPRAQGVHFLATPDLVQMGGGIAVIQHIFYVKDELAGIYTPDIKHAPEKAFLLAL